MSRFAGKVALITGAARGQGRTHAVRLAGEGADIVAVDVCRQISTVPYPLATTADLAETVAGVESLGRQIVAAQADVRDWDSMVSAVEQGLSALGRIDIVVANAGIAPHAVVEADSRQTFADTIAVNLTGVRHTVHACVDSMIAQAAGGSIIITSSTMGLTGRGGTGTGASDGYVASKHAIVGLMRSWANWLAPHRIRVNTIHPTGVNTPMVDNDAMRQYLSAHPDGATNLLPVEVIEPDDLASAVAWLASDEARFVTGVALPVDAGFTAK
jgi:SDR family mycofactocin-dependent oxidoreductase